MARRPPADPPDPADPAPERPRRGVGEREGEASEPPPTTTPSSATTEDFRAEDETFRRAMEKEGPVPDKDSEPDPEEPRPFGRVRRARPPRVRRRRGRGLRSLGTGPRVRRYSDADVLDLHGLSLREAEARLLAFLIHARARDRSRVLVITGRGRRSPGGVPRMKDATERQLRRDPRVAGFEEAPPELGGSGALVVYLLRT
ncbi:MAG: Smr/MutS family protein [Holophagales bacterium]|nr:Smr/MutS family protein [Holophagales bacterium]